MDTFLCTDLQGVLDTGHSKYGATVGERTHAAVAVQPSKGKGKRQRRLSVSVAQDGGSHNALMSAHSLEGTAAAAGKVEGGRFGFGFGFGLTLTLTLTLTR